MSAFAGQLDEPHVSKSACARASASLDASACRKRSDSIGDRSCPAARSGHVGSMPRTVGSNCARVSSAGWSLECASFSCWSLLTSIANGANTFAGTCNDSNAVVHSCAHLQTVSSRSNSVSSLLKCAPQACRVSALVRQRRTCSRRTETSSSCCSLCSADSFAFLFLESSLCNVMARRQRLWKMRYQAEPSLSVAMAVRRTSFSGM